MSRPVQTLEQIDAQAARWVARRDAGLDPSAQAQFECWRAESPLHGEAVARYERTWSALGRPRRTGVAPVLTGELNQALRQRRRRRLGLAAAMVALGFGGFTWWNLPSPAPRGALPGASHTVVLTPERQTLPDGTVVENPPGTVLGVDFSATVRRVALRRGEAHFAVTKDPARPFVVAAGGVEVRAVGTAFSVQLGSSQVEVLVTEGRVAVEKPAPDSAGPRVEPLALVEAGHRLRVEVALQPVALPAVHPVAEEEMADRLAWRATRVEFSGAPLAEVVAVLNQHNRVRFVLGESALGEVALSGLFRADDTDTFTSLLQTGFGIAADRQDGVIVLHRAP
jgi:transmembrane sensor